jgi:hypothetical protein
MKHALSSCGHGRSYSIYDLVRDQILVRFGGTAKAACIPTQMVSAEHNTKERHMLSTQHLFDVSLATELNFPLLDLSGG